MKQGWIFQPQSYRIPSSLKLWRSSVSTHFQSSPGSAPRSPPFQANGDCLLAHIHLTCIPPPFYLHFLFHSSRLPLRSHPHPSTPAHTPPHLPTPAQTHLLFLINIHPLHGLTSSPTGLLVFSHVKYDVTWPTPTHTHPHPPIHCIRGVAGWRARAWVCWICCDISTSTLLGFALFRPSFFIQISS